MSKFSSVFEMGTVCSLCRSSPVPLRFLLPPVASLVGRTASGSPWYTALAQGVQAGGFPLLSVVFYLLTMMIGLMLLITLVVLIRSTLREDRAKHSREWIQTPGPFEGNKQEVQRWADPLEQQHAPSEPLATPMMMQAGFSNEQRFTELPCPQCARLMPASASCCPHCGMSFVVSKSERPVPLSLAVGTFSHPGIKRQHKPNEDSLFAAQGMRSQRSRQQPFGLFIVADGVGGHLYGQEASRIAIQAMIDRMLPILSGLAELQEADFRRLLIEGVQAANHVIYQRNKQQGTSMGTTITVVLVIDDTALVANVGDSRTYLHREAEGLRQITRDHSVVAYLVEKGIIGLDDAYIHPQRNQIYRSLGKEPEVAVDVFREPLRPGDSLLLCSDGLWEMVRDPLIQQRLDQRADPLLTSHELIEAALDGGGADNISVIVILVCQETRCTEVSGLQLLARPETVEMPNIFQK
jgi:serine/threonine protein phosphatase PrpC